MNLKSFAGLRINLTQNTRGSVKLKKHRHEIEFLVLVAVFSLIWLLGSRFNIDVEALQLALESYPLLFSASLYIGLYVIISFFVFFSKDIFWFLGAILFGAALSTLFICAGEIINACILFYLARKLGRAYVEKRLSEKYRHLDEKLGRISFFWLFVFRAAPLIPYRFMDLAAGLTKISFKKYILAVILGSPVKMYWVQYILSGVGSRVFKDPALLVSFFLDNKKLFLLSLIYPFLVILVVFKIRKRD